MLIDAAADSPHTVALVDGAENAEDRRRWTYPDLLAAALGTAHGLLEWFEPGERLAVWGPSMPEWEVMQLGAALAGITVVTVNPAFTAKELAYVLGHSRSAGIAMVPTYRGNDLFAVLGDARSTGSTEELKEPPVRAEMNR